MAKIVLNPAIQVISGDVGGFVYRHQADGSVTLAKSAVRSADYEPSPAQQAQMNKFKEASARFTNLMQNSDTKTAYEQILAQAAPGTRLRTMVIGDILNAPAIDTLDLAKYQGHTGDPIRIVAEDDVRVARLELTIQDTTSKAPVETAQKDLGDQAQRVVEWLYTATANVPDNHTVEVHVVAYDLAGNRIEQVGNKP